MAHGFNDDKSRAQVLTAGEIKRKYMNLPVSTSAMLDPGTFAEISIDVSGVIDVNKIIGFVGVEPSFPQQTIILAGIVPTFDYGRIRLFIKNVGDTASKFSGSVGVIVTYIDQ